MTTLLAATASDLSASETSIPFEAAGGYELTYFGKRLGSEQFEIERRDDGGWTVIATLDGFGEQPGCRSVYELDRDRRFRSATFEPLDPTLLGGTYRVEGTTLIALADDGTEERIELAPDDLIAGPHYVTDFWIVSPIPLAVGDKTTRTVHSFGFKDWTVHPNEVTYRREKDRVIALPDARTNVRMLRCKIDTGENVYKTGSWIDADGVSRRISIGAPIGSANVRLRELSVTAGERVE